MAPKMGCANLRPRQERKGKRKGETVIQQGENRVM